MRELDRCRWPLAPSDAGWEPVLQLQSFGALILNQPAAAPLARTVDMATCPGTVYLRADDGASIEHDYRVIRELERTVLYRG